MQPFWNRLMSRIHFRSRSNYCIPATTLSPQGNHPIEGVGSLHRYSLQTIVEHTPSCALTKVYVPKCIRSMQQSHLLTGSRFEDFSPSCWLDGNLHRFGFISLDLLSGNEYWEDETDDFDTDSTLTTSSETNIYVSDGDSDINYSLFANNERILQPPPYDLPPEEPPPSYEEVLQQDQQHLRSDSFRSLEWMLY